MAVYVDQLVDYRRNPLPMFMRRYGTRWCHLAADTEEELCRFAKRIGVPVRHLQKPGTRLAHFDLMPSVRARAVANGAIELSNRDMGRYLAARGPVFGEAPRGGSNTCASSSDGTPGASPDGAMGPDGAVGAQCRIPGL